MRETVTHTRLRGVAGLRQSLSSPLISILRSAATFSLNEFMFISSLSISENSASRCVATRARRLDGAATGAGADAGMGSTGAGGEGGCGCDGGDGGDGGDGDSC